MPLYNAPNITGGIDDAIVGTAEAVSIFTPMFLFFIFCVVLLGGSISQKKRTGYMDIPLWSTMAGISTLVIALPLSLTAGLIQTETLAVVLTITILSGVWLFFSRSRNEV